ncbi:hypothetical protein MTP99_001199 [Tenebrio molitor]|nr:hypothetical protein MTP99_001199 [Tenebrio molitor]
MSCCSCSNNHNKLVTIKNPNSGLVLDASESHVKLQKYTGKLSQLWMLECIDHGRFVIINRDNSKALDIEGEAKAEAKLITSLRNEKTTQQWYFNSDKTIVCPEKTLAVDVYRGRHTEGTDIIAFPKHGKFNQIFQLEYK